MTFEKIEEAYQLLLENCQLIENDLKTHIYDAIVEQNSFYLGAEGASPQVAQNSDKLKALCLTKEEWRKAYQFLLLRQLRLSNSKPTISSHQMLLASFCCIFWNN